MNHGARALPIALALGLTATWVAEQTTVAALAAKRATSTIPVVMALVGDPVASGLVESLARPGGNVTGLSNQTVELVAKRLQLLKEAIPKATRVTVLFNPDTPYTSRAIGILEAAAPGIGVEPGRRRASRCTGRAEKRRPSLPTWSPRAGERHCVRPLGTIVPCYG